MACQAFPPDEGSQTSPQPLPWSTPQSVYSRPNSADCGMTPSSSSTPASLPQEEKKKPTQLGFYEVEKTIGKGNYAVVKRARHRILKNEVAIKIVDKNRLDVESLCRVKREITILKQFNHPYIMRLYQVMETDRYLYLVTEIAENGDLFEYVQRESRLKEKEARKIFWEMVTAIEFCHENGVVHRDIKTENLLIDRNGSVRLSDFGFSTFYTEKNMLHTYCGSPLYASPEIFSGVAYNGTTSDIWSLGVTLYVMLTGSMPFKGASVPDLRHKVCSGLFSVPFHMSTEAEALLKGMMNVDPTKRFSIEQIKAHPWMQLDSHEQRVKQEMQAYKLCSNEVPVNASVQVLRDLGVPMEKIEHSLNNACYDHTMAMFQLLMERYRKSNFNSMLAELQEAARMNTRGDSVDSGHGSMEKPSRTARPSLSALRGHRQFQTTDTVSSLDETRSTFSRQSTSNTLGSLDEGVDVVYGDQCKHMTVRDSNEASVPVREGSETTWAKYYYPTSQSSVNSSPKVPWNSMQSLYEEVVPSMDDLARSEDPNKHCRPSQDSISEKLNNIAISESKRNLPRKISFGENGDLPPQLLLNLKKSMQAEQQMNGEPHLAHVRLNHLIKKNSNKKRLMYLKQQSQPKSALLEAQDRQVPH